MFDADAQIEIPTALEPLLQELSEKSRLCIRNLFEYISNSSKSQYSLSTLPIIKLAGVLVLLYERDDELRVLLTTRSHGLRTHAGQTALPGGKVDLEDDTFVATAVREANEEVDLPLDSPHIHVLGRLNPYIAMHGLVVVPVIAILTEPDTLKDLKASEGEVAHIFSHPLEAILDPPLAQKENLVAIGSDEWPYEDEFYCTSDSSIQMLGNTTYRMHRFRTSASPVKGLTADILIKTSEIAYDRPTVYKRYAPNQLTDFPTIIKAVTDYHVSKDT